MTDSKRRHPEIPLPVRENLPKKLLNHKHWLNWQYRWNGKKWTKPPVGGTSVSADMTFDEALERAIASKGELGVGIALMGKFVGVDLDNVLTRKGRIKKKYHPWISKLVETTYCEVSPSGKGLRLISLRNDKIPTIGSRKGSPIEVYHTGRYLTITGNIFGEKRPISKIPSKYIPAQEPMRAERELDGGSVKVDVLRPLLFSLNPDRADNYEDWLKIGMIVHQELDGSEEGFRLWDLWSGQSSKYSEAICRKKWRGFGKYSGERVTLGTLVHMVDKDKKRRALSLENDGVEFNELELWDQFDSYVIGDKEVEDLENVTFLIEDLIPKNQRTNLCAFPNAGKTAICFFEWCPKFIEKGMTVVYVDEDSPPDAIKDMYEFSKKHGKGRWKYIRPTFGVGRSTAKFMEIVERLLTEQDKPFKDHVFIFDTLKKFADMLDKGSIKEFYQFCSRLTLAGATVILSGHANKNLDMNGEMKYEGVGDVANDTDNMLYMYYVRDEGRREQTVSIYPDKVRAKIKKTTYVFSLNDRRKIKRVPFIDVRTAAKKAVSNRISERKYLYQTIRDVVKEMQPIKKTALSNIVRDKTGIGRDSVNEAIDWAASEENPLRLIECKIDNTKNNTHEYHLYNREMRRKENVDGEK